MECLLTDNVCSNTNKKCKVCVLDNCKEVIRMIDIQEKKKNEMLLKKLKEELPEQCKTCGLIEIVNVSKGKVRCFYNVNGKCILN